VTEAIWCIAAVVLAVDAVLFLSAVEWWLLKERR